MLSLLLLFIILSLRRASISNLKKLHVWADIFKVYGFYHFRQLCQKCKIAFKCARIMFQGNVAFFYEKVMIGVIFDLLSEKNPPFNDILFLWGLCILINRFQ